MSVTTYTSGAGPRLVLLHGFGFHAEIWTSLAATLSKNFHVTRVDLPGYGQSTALLEPYTLPALIDHLHPLTTTPATWIGWSFGGIVATALAERYPHAVTRLVLLANAARFTANAEWPGVEASLLTAFTRAIAHNPEKALQRFLHWQLATEKSSCALVEELKTLVFRHGTPSAIALLGSLAILEENDQRDILRALPIPILQLLGENDTLAPPTSAPLMRALSTNIQTEIIEDAGHLLQVTQEQTVIDRVKRFYETTQHTHYPHRAIV